MFDTTTLTEAVHTLIMLNDTKVSLDDYISKTYGYEVGIGDSMPIAYTTILALIEAMTDVETADFIDWFVTRDTTDTFIYFDEEYSNVKEDSNYIESIEDLINLI